jgi:hypothetical protein
MPVIPYGTAIHSSHGRKCPQRDRVRSAIMPMRGSSMVSQMRVISNIVPAAAAVMPNTSV